MLADVLVAEEPLVEKVVKAEMLGSRTRCFYAIMNGVQSASRGMSAC
jgi:hypothetical protein